MENQVTVIATNKTTKVRKELHIHDDIALSILSKLSIKPLKRFECVCKSWSLLFDNSYFMSNFRKSLLTKYHSYYDDAFVLLHQPAGKFELYFLYEDEMFVSNVKINSSYRDGGFIIVGCGSVHGIICVSFIKLRDIILLNPSTKEYKLIPPVCSHHEFHQKGYIDCGFGYDCVEDDYKVMCIRYGEEEPMEIEYSEPFVWKIFSLRNNTWKKLEVDKKHNPNSWSTEQLYIDGFSHRVCEIERHCDERYVLSFDWHREIFTTTPIPFDIDRVSDFLHGWRRLLLLNGSIGLILKYKATLTFQIFILGELGVKESWTKMFTIESLSYLEYPIGMGTTNDILFRRRDAGLVWFDLITQKFKDLSFSTDTCYSKIAIHKANPISLRAYVGKNI